jgi:hypothetical protein
MPNPPCPRTRPRPPRPHPGARVAVATCALSTDYASSSVPAAVASTLPLALGLGLGISAGVLLAMLFFWMLVRRRRRRAAPYAKFAANSDENMRAAAGPLVGMPPETTHMPPTEATLLVAPHVSAPALTPPHAPAAVFASESCTVPVEQRPTGTPERRPKENMAAGLSWKGQRPPRLASALFGTSQDALLSRPDPNASSTLPAGGASPNELRPAAEAIATEELLRELDARGVLPNTHEPPPVYEEASR